MWLFDGAFSKMQDILPAKPRIKIQALQQLHLK
jgi:hypothetical protein